MDRGLVYCLVGPTGVPAGGRSTRSDGGVILIVHFHVSGAFWYAMKMLRQLARPRQPLHLVFLQALQQRPILGRIN